jgi:hypothetical protein
MCLILHCVVDLDEIMPLRRSIQHQFWPEGATAAAEAEAKNKD